MARVRWPNQLSMPRENVMVAPVASGTAGIKAMTENRATTRACRRAPGILSFQACLRPLICTHRMAIIVPIRMTLTAIISATMSLRGTIGVRPVMIR